jgi:hypothetical protein
LGHIFFHHPVCEAAYDSIVDIFRLGEGPSEGAYFEFAASGAHRHPTIGIVDD